MEKHSYHVHVNWNSGRRGMICSPDLVPVKNDHCIEIATPPEFPGGVAGIWSPEHLFTAAVASCLMTTFLAIAENSKLSFSRFSCSSEGVLEETDRQLSIRSVILKPVVAIAAEKDRDRALNILRKAESACLIAHSVKSRIAMVPTIITASV